MLREMWHLSRLNEKRGNAMRLLHERVLCQQAECTKDELGDLTDVNRPLAYK